MPQKPHIVIFNPDQWRGDVLGHAGNPAAVTPHLDRLVGTEAVSFTGTYCQNPVCTPSRCSFMTGWYPHVRGHRTMTHMLRAHEPCLLKTLKDQGYFVWWGGKNDLVPAQHGYANYCHVKYAETAADIARWGYTRRDDWPWNQTRGQPGSDTYYSFYVGKLDNRGQNVFLDQDWAWVLGAVDQIRAWGRAKTEQPLCLYLPLGFPHPPYQVEEPYYSMIDPRKVPRRIPAPADWAGKPSMLKGIHRLQNMQGWSEERWTELRRTYYGMCARVDAQLGLVVNALKEAGLWEDTALFFFADHGDFTGDYGLVEKTQNTFEDCLTRVPFIIKPPAATPCRPGRRRQLVELIDFPATVEALTGTAFGYSHFGRSLLPLMADENQPHRDAVFCEGGRLQSELHCREPDRDPDLRQEHAYYPRMKMQFSDGPEHTKATMCRTVDFKFVQRLYESDELYDLKKDPAELHNVAGDPAYEPVLRQMKDRLLKFYLETADVVPLDQDMRWLTKSRS
ncbi:MAG: sulfatase-like hydrolase/transferase [Phycisphaeraceae bacterium]|nr:sulfatase-like hydrolase/transferase [Phycisphaeraceae bacterium]